MLDRARTEAILRESERSLAEVPAWLWDGTSLPVPIDEIADSHFGLLVREVDDIAGALSVDTPGHLSGVLIPDAAEIWVDASEARRWPRRRRFTIAHEIGHWVLHRAPNRTVHCRSVTIRPPSPAAQALAATDDDVEDEANLFGGGLLMPPKLLWREHRRLHGDDRALCDLFGVSESAFGVDRPSRGRAGMHLDYAASYPLGP